MLVTFNLLIVTALLAYCDVCKVDMLFLNVSVDFFTHNIIC